MLNTFYYFYKEGKQITCHVATHLCNIHAIHTSTQFLFLAYYIYPSPKPWSANVTSSLNHQQAYITPCLLQLVTLREIDANHNFAVGCCSKHTTTPSRDVVWIVPLPISDSISCYVGRLLNIKLILKHIR